MALYVVSAQGEMAADRFVILVSTHARRTPGGALTVELEFRKSNHVLIE